MPSPTVLIPSVRVVGTNGQISLGKQFAGRQVLIEEQETGVWLIRTATVVPDNERWIHAPLAATEVAAALTWALQNPPSDAGLPATLNHLSHGEQ